MNLAELVGEGADAARVADYVVAVWQQIEDALTPIIGPRGVAALYKRSLFLIGPDHPWLTRLQEADASAVDAAALRSALAQQDTAAAATAGGALLQTFQELLASLVGPSLTGRLLAAAWALPTSGPSAQDTSP
ncbi:MAG TPA: hypothetical protein VFG21_04280 [Xanthomonadaceae bacterium]|nr:hypothetical protein [Xanthomonadaceae bacterium]